MFTSIVIALAVVLVIYLFMQSPRFGVKPTGLRSKKLVASPNFKNSQFQNQHDTPSLTNNAGILTVTRKFFFEKDKRNKRAGVIPSTKTDLHAIAPTENVLVWF